MLWWLCGGPRVRPTWSRYPLHIRGREEPVEICTDVRGVRTKDQKLERIGMHPSYQSARDL